MTVAIIGAGLAGIIAALAAAEAGVAYEIFDRNDEVGGTWLTTTYPGIGVDTPSAYYSLSREVNPDWSSTTRRARSTRPIWWSWPTSTACASTPGSAPRSRPCGGTRTVSSGRSTRLTATATVTSATRASSSPLPATSTGRACRICRPGYVRGHQHSLRTVGSVAGPRR